jgi:hypothetical protein
LISSAAELCLHLTSALVTPLAEASGAPSR